MNLVDVLDSWKDVLQFFNEFYRNNMQVLCDTTLHGEVLCKLPRHRWVVAGGRTGHPFSSLLKGKLGQRIQAKFANPQGGVLVYANDAHEIAGILWCNDLDALRRSVFDEDDFVVLATHEESATFGRARRMGSAIRTGLRAGLRKLAAVPGKVGHAVAEDPSELIWAPPYWLMVGSMLPVMKASRWAEGKLGIKIGRGSSGSTSSGAGGEVFF